MAQYRQYRDSAAQAPSGSSGPGANLGPDATMSSPTLSIKVVATAGDTWTPAPRAVTSAPVSAVANLIAVSIQQVTILT